MTDGPMLVHCYKHCCTQHCSGIAVASSRSLLKKPPRSSKQEPKSLGPPRQRIGSLGRQNRAEPFDPEARGPEH